MYITINFGDRREDILSKLSTHKGILWVDEIICFLNEWWNSNKYFVAHTSGSTGEPKRIKIEKNKALGSATITGEYFSFNKNTTALLCMSPKFIAGKMMLVRADLWKMNLICVEPSSKPLESIPTSLKVNFVAMVPLQFHNSLSKLKSSRVEKLLVGGGAIDKDITKELWNINTEIFSSYGMTETITHVALKQINGDGKSKYFKALNGVSFKLDSRKCLVINAKSISDVDIVTNDIVELKNDKEFIWLGRLDNVINTGGVKINPEIVEEKISSIIDAEFFISSIKDFELGEKIILIVENRKKKISIDLEELKSILPKFHNPKLVFYINEFTRTDSGKINRKETLKRIFA
jgi:O-succinylbenzoic acid--CoA ligase